MNGFKNKGLIVLKLQKKNNNNKPETRLYYLWILGILHYFVNMVVINILNILLVSRKFCFNTFLFC